MKDRAYRQFPFLIFGLTLLALAPGAAVAAARCGPCVDAQKACAVGCFDRTDKAGFVACMMGCDNAAALCACDGQASLRSEDFVRSAGWRGVAKDACHGTVSCQPNYPSCAGWSGYADCGDPQCGIYRWCGDCGDPFGCWDLATRQPRERFRVCFDQFGNSCTEWQGTLVLVACGC